MSEVQGCMSTWDLIYDYASVQRWRLSAWIKLPCIFMTSGPKGNARHSDTLKLLRCKLWVLPFTWDLYISGACLLQKQETAWQAWVEQKHRLPCLSSVLFTQTGMEHTYKNIRHSVLDAAQQCSILHNHENMSIKYALSVKGNLETSYHLTLPVCLFSCGSPHH